MLPHLFKIQNAMQAVAVSDRKMIRANSPRSISVIMLAILLAVCLSLSWIPAESLNATSTRSAAAVDDEWDAAAFLLQDLGTTVAAHPRGVYVKPLLIAGLWQFQDFQRSNRRFSRRGYYHFDEVEVANQRNGVPMWELDQQFRRDVFTFARVKYTSSRDVWGRPQWAVDFPDSDLNLSYRLQQLTSMKVAPEGAIVRFTDPEIFDYPFVYLIEPGQIDLTPAEVDGMRKYLERGGFIMIDDFWGEYEWNSLKQQLDIVLPGRQIQTVPLSDEIFNIVYQLKEKPQIPSIGFYMRGQTSDRWDATQANYRCVRDDEGNIMIMICHNTDLGDGWEREGMDRGYFEMFSEKYAYPLGINIITYALTH